MKIVHYLYTRFNLRTETVRIDRSGVVIDPLSNIWIENRMKLFLKYCWPTIVNQKFTDFKWIVHFAPETPEFFYEGLSDEFPNFIPFKGDSFKEWVVENTPEDTDYVVTSRVDNDDGLSVEYFNAIHTSAINNINLGNPVAFVINPERGIVMKTDTYKYSIVNEKSNPFITLVEPFRGNESYVQTVLAHRHIVMEDHFKTIRLNTKSPLWMRVIHETNLLNIYYGSTSGRFQLEHLFPIDINLRIERSRPAIKKYNKVKPHKPVSNKGRRGNYRK